MIKIADIAAIRSSSGGLKICHPFIDRRVGLSDLEPDPKVIERYHYAGDKLRRALASMGPWTVEIIKRSDAAKSSEVLPRR
jgi:transposase